MRMRSTAKAGSFCWHSTAQANAAGMSAAGGSGNAGVERVSGVKFADTGSLVKLAVLLRVTHPLVVALNLHVDVGIMRALGRRAGADLDEYGVAIRTIDKAVAIRHACLPGGRVARFQHGFAAILAQHNL